MTTEFWDTYRLLKQEYPNASHSQLQAMTVVTMRERTPPRSTREEDRLVDARIVISEMKSQAELYGRWAGRHIHQQRQQRQQRQQEEPDIPHISPLFRQAERVRARTER